MDGGQCHAHAMRGTSLCFSHNPEKKAEKLIAVRRGGEVTKAHYIKNKKHRPPVEIRSPFDALQVIEEGINELRYKGRGVKEILTAGQLAFMATKILHDWHLENEIKLLNSIVKPKREIK
jgi:hypothetical protein